MTDATAPVLAPRSEFRFSLRTLLIGLGAVSLFLAPVHWFGGAYLFSATCSVILIFGCTIAYRGTPAATIVPAGVGILIGFWLVMAVLTFLVHALANGLACLILIAFKPRPGTFAVLLVAVMLAIYAFAFSLGVARLSELRALREKYPFESLSLRLAFERANQPRDAPPPIIVPMSAAVAANLTAQESARDRSKYFSRTAALRELHEDISREFARAAGFGFMRMDSLTYRVVEFYPSEPFTLPAPTGITQPQPSNSDLTSFHNGVIGNFFDADRIGYVKNRDAVAGFESHRINGIPGGWKESLPKKASWQVVRLELVGLLRANPRVYLSETLPPLEKIVESPSRPLNEFEQSALRQLISQEDIVTDVQPERIQMLGALRAGVTCLQCHEGKRGKLLGAFSYAIVPTGDSQKSTRHPVE